MAKVNLSLKNAGLVQVHGPNGQASVKSLDSLLHLLRAPSRIERYFLSLLFGSIALIVAIDLTSDVALGASDLHLIMDTALGITSLLGIFFFWLRLGRSRLRLAIERELSEHQTREWRSRAQELEDGIAGEIDQQLDRWGLSEAEKEVGLLLLKGLSIKEIAHLRGTSDRTVRHQSLGVYAKAAVTGRAELSAYFLEEFLDRKRSPRTLSKTASVR